MTSLMLEGLLALVRERSLRGRDEQDAVRAQVGDDVVGVAVGRKSPFPGNLAQHRR